MGHSKLRLFLIATLLVALPLLAHSAANKWQRLGGGDSNVPSPGQMMRFQATATSGTTELISMAQCGDDSSAFVASTSSATLVTQICKESSGGNIDCETDSDAGPVTAGGWAMLRLGPYVRFTYSGATAGEYFYVSCSS